MQSIFQGLQRRFYGSDSFYEAHKVYRPRSPRNFRSTPYDLVKSRRNGTIVFLAVLGVAVASIFSYSIAAVRQEDFADVDSKGNRPEKVRL